jgi:tetratricopeptide (TPR) repeat protein
MVRFRSAPVLGVVEWVEAEFGEALAWRDALVQHAAASGSLGPPDLVWLRKAPADGRCAPEGAYHLRLGGEVSQQGARAYVHSLRLVQPAGLARLLQPQTELQGAIVCCYDAFGRRDVRTELSLGGHGAEACGSTLLDAAGEQHEVANADWEGARVSAALRRLCWPSRACLTPEAGCVRILGARPGPMSPATESALLADVLALRARPDASSQLRPAASAAHAVDTALDEDPLLWPLLRHFLSQRRAAAAASFMARCAAGDGPDAAPLMAAAFASQRRLAEALAALRLNGSEEEGAARLLAASRAHSASGDAAAAVECALRAARIEPGARAAWLQTAAALAAAGEWGRSLVALNCAPAVGEAEQRAEWHGGLAVPPPARARDSGQGVPGCAAEMAMRCAAELERAAGRESLAELPAAALLPPPEQLTYAAGGGMSQPPPSAASAAAADAYSVLVDATSELGWEALLALRSSLFVMEGGSDAPSSPAVAMARDREALLAAAPLPPRRLCADWLDALFGALYGDVAEYSEWRAAEAAEAAAEEAMRAGDAAVAATDADTEAALGTHGDWLHRGALCERLKRGADAERAYRIAVHLCFSLSAWAALSRIYADWGWAAEALTALGHVAHALDCDPDDPPPCLSAPLAALVASVGLQVVRDAQVGLELPRAISEALFDVVRWKVPGFDA